MTFTSSHSDLKQINRLAVINLIKKQPSLSRADIAKHTGLTKSTIGKIVQELIDEHWLQEEDAPTLLEGAGRRPTGLTLDNRTLTLLGAEIGVDFITVIACSITGEVRFHSNLPYQHNQLESSLDQLADLLTHVWRMMHSMNHHVLGLGISVPGMVNMPNEHVAVLPNLGWQNFNLIELMRSRFTMQQLPLFPITIVNDANAAALSEFVFGRSQFNRNPLVHITVGVGVGAGITSENGLYRGTNGWAGEIGHSVLQPINGLPCACGQYGCVETLVSQRALSRALTSDSALLSIESMQRRLAQGDVAVKAGLDEVGYYLGIVLRNVANYLNPESIVIGGPMSQFEDALMKPAIASFQAHSKGNLILPNIRLCEFGQWASSLGAAAAILIKHLEPNGIPVHFSHQGLLRK